MQWITTKTSNLRYSAIIYFICFLVAPMLHIEKVSGQQQYRFAYNHIFDQVQMQAPSSELLSRP